ncbi:MAG: SRPBCC family protein [Bacteroidota bacterium]
MHIETSKKTVNRSAKEVFEFLSHIKNFEKLMPENIQKFEVLDETTFRFALSGMPEIVLRKKEEFPYHKIILGAASSKLSFSLICAIEELSTTQCDTQLSFQGKFNAMMAMMIKGPITNFINTLSDNLAEI